ncbi:hypothetical protein ACXNSR_00070 [Streptomyces sp. NC-S4]
MALSKRTRVLATTFVLVAAGVAAATAMAEPPSPTVERHEAPPAPGDMTAEELETAFRNGDHGQPGGPMHLTP